MGEPAESKASKLPSRRNVSARVMSPKVAGFTRTDQMHRHFSRRFCAPLHGIYAVDCAGIAEEAQDGAVNTNRSHFMQQILDTRATIRRPSSSSFATRLLRRVIDADRRYRERRALVRLSNEQLDDIGQSRAEIGRMMRGDSRS
ncbi:DUF1127 domain-containing protein [Pseudoruegeria sp. M32A2M]|nr:DUF1127 domain-containing protein [Pseudoruegeria sp. M32A2M]